MVFQQHSYTLLGGLLIGFAAGMVLLANGRAAGVSGMVSSVVRPRSADAAWQALFLVGLVAGGMGLAWLDPAALPSGESAPLQLMIGAGLLVGFGARLAGNFTSGRAQCGIWATLAAWSPVASRSLCRGHKLFIRSLGRKTVLTTVSTEGM